MRNNITPLAPLAFAAVLNPLKSKAIYQIITRIVKKPNTAIKPMSYPLMLLKGPALTFSIILSPINDIRAPALKSVRIYSGVRAIIQTTSTSIDQQSC